MFRSEIKQKISMLEQEIVSATEERKKEIEEELETLYYERDRHNDDN